MADCCQVPENEDEYLLAGVRHPPQ